LLKKFKLAATRRSLIEVVSRRMETNSMRPSMLTNFMSRHVLVDMNIRMLIEGRTDNEKGRCDILLVQVLEQITEWDGEVRLDKGRQAKISRC
jgi:hypothetical protein